MSQGEQRKLLTVEEVFFIEGRGVVVLPGIPKYAGPCSISVAIRKPSGDEVLVQANLSFIRRKGQKGSLTVELCGLTKEDVPVGTEIWMVDQSTLPVA